MARAAMTSRALYLRAAPQCHTPFRNDGVVRRPGAHALESTQSVAASRHADNSCVAPPPLSVAKLNAAYGTAAATVAAVP